MRNVEFRTGDFPDVTLDIQELERENTALNLSKQPACDLERAMEQLRIHLLKNAKRGTFLVSDMKKYRLLILVKQVLREKINANN